MLFLDNHLTRPTPAMPIRCASSGRRRRGTALLVMLLLVSMALSLSYAAMRGQYTTVQIQRNYGRNSDRRSSAQLAALIGMSMALRRMHVAADWQGVDVPWGRPLGEYEGFNVTYQTGDSSLDSDHPDYEEFPYRVTVSVTGYAVEPDDPSRQVTHRVRAVVRLVPRWLADEPADWDWMTDYTVCQWKEGTCRVNVPCRIEGPVRIQKRLELSEHYPWSWSARSRYLRDLGKMRLSGYPDWRPFDGPVDLPYSKQSAGVVALMSAGMGITTNDLPKKAAVGFTHPGELKTYHLYPGGKTYSAVVLGQDHRDVVREPDPETNPLGIYYRREKAKIYDNVTFQGTLVTYGGPGANVEVHGTNVNFLPHDLPPLEGTDVPIRLPTIVSIRDVRFEPGSKANVTGMVAAIDDVRIRSDQQYDMALTVQGRIVTKELYFDGRSDWVHSSDWWNEKYAEFIDQKDEEGTVKRFPIWMQIKWGLDPKPQLTVKPDPTPVRYHWHNSQNPVYVSHPDDDGLRWELLEWAEVGD